LCSERPTYICEFYISKMKHIKTSTIAFNSNDEADSDVNKSQRVTPLRNVKQRQKRVAWYKERKNSSLELWQKALWSDESKVCIFGSDSKKYVRRRAGEAFNPACTIKSMKTKDGVM